MVHRCVLFGRLLRELGMAVTPAQVVDLLAGLNHIDLGRREDFRAAACAVFVTRREHIAVFEMAFNLYWARHPWDAQGLLPLQRPASRAELTTAQVADQLGAPLLPSSEASDDEARDRTQSASTREQLRHTDFAHLDQDELVAVRRLIAMTPWQIEYRRMRRTRSSGRDGLLDLRRTVRRSLRHGGEPLVLVRRQRVWKPRRLVVLCDISGSMERYTRLLLQFIYTIHHRLNQVETFVFGTRLTRITRQIRQRDVDQALEDAVVAIQDWGGGTRIGAALKEFNYVWGRRVLGQGAVVLIISDGWDRGEPDLLAREIDRLHRSCYRLIWLNPLLGSPGYQPLVRGIQAALPHVDEFLPVHNLVSLEQLAAALSGTRWGAKHWRRLAPFQSAEMEKE